MKDFLINYNKADHYWALWIGRHLEDGGYHIKLKEWDTRPGTNFMQEIERLGREYAHIVALISPDYLLALNARSEWPSAFAKDAEGAKSKIIPVRIRNCELKGVLGGLTLIDLINMTEDAARNALFAKIASRHEKPEAPPSESERQVSELTKFPGSVPHIWNIKYGRNPDFTGRETLLNQLRDELSMGDVVVLNGPDGMGKSQVALKYAYDNENNYDIVWWIRADDLAFLESDFAALAEELNFPDRELKTRGEIVDFTRQWLEYKPGWLLIFDNALSVEDLKRYIPTGSTGHVLVTSKNPGWGKGTRVVTVSAFYREEAIKFLQKRTGKMVAEEAASLADELTFMPQALELAGAHISQTGVTFSKYLKMYRNVKNDIMNRDKASIKYPIAISATLEILSQLVQEVSTAGIEIMNLCAYLSPDDIPMNILKEGHEHMPKTLAKIMTNAKAFEYTIGILRRYSLIDVGSDNITINRLVQSIMRDKHSSKERLVWAEAAFRIMNDAFPDNCEEKKSRAECSRLLPHALTAARYAEVLKIDPPATLQLYSRLGLIFKNWGAFLQAKNIMLKVLKLSETVHGPDYPGMGNNIKTMGEIYHAQGELENARGQYKKAIDIYEKNGDMNRPEVAVIFNNLGSIMLDLGDEKAARTYYEKALSVLEKKGGKETSVKGAVLSNLGCIVWDAGEAEAARDYFERALGVYDKTLDGKDPEVSTAVNNLGAVLQDLGDLKGAKKQFERALSIDGSVYGNSHPEVATDLNNIAGVLWALEDYNGARNHYERALKIFEEIYGKDHPDTATVKENIEALASHQK
ncbi:MAG: toll/interleukin-1 receptor domain-containing protein [Chloroflexi bacterium]|nr:toll/interleukin-1 receptor domain-containing protein [Chloroflexota bacterium]